MINCPSHMSTPANTKPTAASDPAPKTLPDGKCVVQQLVETPLYRRFYEAFGELTGMPLALHPRDYWQAPLRGTKRENPFCAMMAEHPRACSCCMETQAELTESAQGEGRVVTCPFGLIDIAVPVHMDGQCVAFLHTGQVFPRPPSKAQFERAAEKLKQWQLGITLPEMEKSYRSAAVYTRRRQDAVLQLLAQFAEQLTEKANTLLLRARHEEPPLIARAKCYLREHMAETIRLEDLAAHLHVSTYYFCKQFRKHPGLRFTDYLARLRVQQAQRMLQDPNRRVSEVAFEVGFLSLPHFNRTFKRITGTTPTLWRQN